MKGKYVVTNRNLGNKAGSDKGERGDLNYPFSYFTG
jgi:hypothetical protein